MPTRSRPSKQVAVAVWGVLTGCLFAMTPLHNVRAQGAPAAAPNQSAGKSCDDYLPQRLPDQRTGPESCQILSEETVSNIKGQPFRRLELRITGTLDGWIARQGPRATYFNDGPDFVFAQSGNTSPRFHGIGRYEGATGHGITLFIPQDAADWNGKLFVTAHGAGPYGAVGPMMERDPDADYNPLADQNRYVGLMIDRGYAVAHTLRASHLNGGDVAVTLDDGTVLPNNNVSSHVGFMADFTGIAQSFVTRSLGRLPSHRYFYGFSAGAMMGRLIQYQPGANMTAGGRRLFDAFLLDDAGGGMWLPVLDKNGRDTLFVGSDARRFVPQIDLSHQLYLGDDGRFLDLKRQNAVILRQKGLGDRHRMYEIRGVSHFDAGQTSVPELVPRTLDLGGLMGSMLDTLDRWIETGAAPPPTRSDLAELAGRDRAEQARNAALAFPEVACPLGVHHVFPQQHGDGRRGFQETAFAIFDGETQEPLDGRGKLVDMNQNGTRDRRETVAQAWTRLGMLKPGERVDRRRYVACISTAAATLVEQGFFAPGVLGYYARRAAETFEAASR